MTTYNSIETAGKVKNVTSSQVAIQDTETQTEIDMATRHFFEETHEYKFQIFKLKEQIKDLEEKNQQELPLAKEKLVECEKQIKSL